MTFDELVQEVYYLTKRPDLVDETKSAIRAATLKAHQTDFYSKDIYETNIQAPDLDYVHSIDYISIIPNFRALKYIRKLDPTTLQGIGRYIEIITPEEVFDSYGSQRADVAYIAGRVIELRSSTQINELLLGCYVFPIVTYNAYASWIADLYPYCIIYDAARVIFKTIGYDEQSAQYNNLVAEQYALLKSSALTDVGY